MSFKTIKRDHFTLIEITTEKFDAIVAPDLKAELVYINKQGEKNILVDMVNVKYCDSSGLSALLIGNRVCKESQGSFILISIQPNVEKLIAISQLDSILLIKTNLQEAIDTLLLDNISGNSDAENIDD